MMNKKFSKLAAFFLLLALPKATMANDVVVRVNNVSDVQRQHLVEIELKTLQQKMGIGETESFILLNAQGQELAYQKTYDGKVVFDACAMPCRSTEYRFTLGTPQPMRVWVQGGMYPLRKDDIAWENDRGAYRAYGPALQRSGEKAYGIDAWTKNTPDLVVARRYYDDYLGNVKKDVSRKTGDEEAFRKVDLATSFHLDHGDGLDCYSVGPTLGCGTPALMDGGKLVMPYCYKTYRILDNGPLRFTVELVYNPVAIGNDKEVVEHRIISLDKGSNFNKVTVWYEGLSTARDMAAGLVVHADDVQSTSLGKDFVLYADPTDRLDHGYQLYVGVLFPYGAQTMKQMLDKPENGNAGHLIGVVKDLKDGQRYTYYFGSAWSCYDVRSFNEWKLRAQEFLDAIYTPFDVEIE